MLIGDEVIGAINCYAHARDTFTNHAVQMGVRFAATAAVSLHNSQLLSQARDRVEDLQGAMNRRAVIYQAIGVIRGRYGFGADDAFTVLRSMSQSENEKLYVIAERVIDDAVHRADSRPNPI